MEKQIVDADRGDQGVKLFDIFVAGIPATTDLETVSRYFCSLGPVKKLELLKIGKKSRGNKLPKQFYRLTTSSVQLFSRLLNPHAPLFYGRKLFCQVYKRGDDLATHSADVNARRVVVKQVPHAATDDDVRAALRKSGGPLETLYEYKSEVDIKTDYSVLYKTYSATFESSSHVLGLIENGKTLLASGVEITIEQFLYKRKLNSEIPSKPVNLSKITTKKLLDNDFSKKNYATTQKKVANSFGERKSYQANKATIDSSKNQPKDSAHDKPTSLPKWLVEGYKPTSAIYHLSKQALTYQPNDKLHLAQLSNLRFNIQLPSS